MSFIQASILIKTSWCGGRMAEQVTKSGVFVCLGNLCLLPTAEAVFRKLVTDQNISDTWRMDSAVTSTYELGNPPDYRGQVCMKKHGSPMSHVAQQVTKEDFAPAFDCILRMDESNRRDLNRKSNQVKNCRPKFELLGSYEPQKQLIFEDRYDGSNAHFETTYQQCVQCCRAALEKIRWPGSRPARPKLIPTARRLSGVSQGHSSLAQGHRPVFRWLTVSYLKK